METEEPGAARSPGITYQQLLDTDTHDVPAVLRIESPQYLGSEDISRDRYITCLLYTSPSPRDQRGSRMPSSA